MMLPTGRVVKNNSPVQYENILDINDIVLGTQKVSIISKIGAAFTQNGIMHQSDIQDRQAKEMPVISMLQPNNQTSIKELDLDSPPGIEDVAEISKLEKVTPTAPSAITQHILPTPFIYRLSAVILHYGNHDSGHFVTLRRDFERDLWFRVSDANVERIVDVEQEVFGHGSRYAYMIFYEKVEVE